MKFLKQFERQWRMFRDLWSIVKPDCRGPLIGELIFNPDALERRWDEEQRFKSNLHSRWT